MEAHEKGFFTEENSIEVVTGRNKNAKDERLKQIMEVVTRKLHEAVREIEPTQEEWMEAILLPHTHRADVQRMAARVHPFVRHARRLDAG